jgi:threonine/homoserine/homoserine lactone efflux protein
MNDQNKNNLDLGLEVLLLVLGGLLGIMTSAACFNYATLAKQAGDNQDFFWLVGIANLVFWGFNIYHRAKAMKSNKKNDAADGK